MTNYEAKNIQTLDPVSHIRKYCGMYIGSKDAHGLLHCVKEIISNSIDEYLNASNDFILVRLQKDGGIYIKDEGRGIPRGQHESGCSILQACASIINTGGKFNNATGNSGYNSAGGQHGVGIKAVNALADKFIISSSREGRKETVEFSKGQFINSREEKTNKTGVEVLFYPDSTIFETVEFDSEKLQIMLQEFSYLCSGLKFNFIDEKRGVNKEFLSHNGLFDYINFLSKSQKLLIEPIYLNEREGMYQVEVALAYTDSFSSVVKLYTNNIPQEKGTHLTGFRTALTSTLNSFAREKGWIKEKEPNLIGSDLEEGQILIINFKMIDPVFKGQNKEELSSSEGRTYVQKLSTIALKNYFATNEKDIKAIIEKALSARKAREAARKAREAARGLKQKKESGLKGKMQLSDKFIDCGNRNPKDRNLLLVEGKSAATSAVEARNPKTDCIYMLRGKIISPLRTAIDKILSNQEMSDIIKVIGAGFDSSFDVSKMNFNKVVITSDQDSDGFDIELSLITFFYTYMRALVEAGKLYRAVTPLYIIRQKGKEYYTYSDKELEEWKQTHNGTFELTRAKGLGELNPKDLRTVCFEQERYKRITIKDAEKTTELLNILMGGAVEPRKQYIYDNATELGFHFD